MTQTTNTMKKQCECKSCQCHEQEEPTQCERISVCTITFDTGETFRACEECAQIAEYESGIKFDDDDDDDNDNDNDNIDKANHFRNEITIDQCHLIITNTHFYYITPSRDCNPLADQGFRGGPYLHADGVWRNSTVNEMTSKYTGCFKSLIECFTALRLLKIQEGINEVGEQNRKDGLMNATNEMEVESDENEK